MFSVNGFLKALGIAVQIIILGEALFLAVAMMYSMQTQAQVFRYAGF